MRYSRNQPNNPNMVHVVIVVDGGLLEAEDDQLRESGYEGVTIIDLCNYAPRLAVSRGIKMVVEDGECLGRGATGNQERFATIDRVSAEQAQQLARRLAPYRAATQRSSDVETDETETISTWSQLMSLGDIGSFNPEPARGVPATAASVCACRSASAPTAPGGTRHQGSRRERHGPARPVHRRDRFG